MNKPVQVYSADQIASAKARAEERAKEIHAEGHAEGVKHGLRLAERYRAAAYVGVGFVVGCIFMGLFTAATMTNATFTAGAVVDRVLGRTVETPVLPSGPRVTPAEEYLSNAETAREDACAEGVRGACTRGP